MRYNSTVNRQKLAWIFFIVFFLAPLIAAFLYAVTNPFWVVPATLGLVSFAAALLLGADE